MPGPGQEQSKGPNKGLIIGIIVGAGVLVLALVITLVVWLFSVSDVGDPIDTSAGQSSGTEIDNDLPPAPVLPAGSRVAAGDHHSCAITEDEQVWCWGNNDLKQSNPASDEKVVGPTQLDVHDAVALAASSSNTCALHDDKTLTCWGRNDLKTLGVADYDSSKLFHTPDLTEPVIAVSAGPNHFCALTENGEVYCWGWNGIGEAVPQAYPAVEKVAVPTKVRLEQKASMIAGGNDHTCAVLEDNSVACWGRAEYGATGVDTKEYKENAGGEITTISLPVDVTAAQVAAGLQRSCIRSTEGEVYCWGNNMFATFGTDEPTYSPTPVKVPLPTSVKYLTMRQANVCAIGEDDVTYCWGEQSTLIGTDEFRTPEPTKAPVDTVFYFITLDFDHACGIAAGDQVTCWGKGREGNLGDPGMEGDHFVNTVALK